MTGAAGYYSENDSYAYGIAHKSYFGGDKWRIGGFVGAMDFELELWSPDDFPGAKTLDWLIEGQMGVFNVQRRIRGNWYGGINLRYLELEQSFELSQFRSIEIGFPEVETLGAGVNLEHDSRDTQFNPYSGNLFSARYTYNTSPWGNNRDYEAADIGFSSYHKPWQKTVIAWELQGCYRTKQVPLWDACSVGLRGFSATRYLGTESASAQVELRRAFTEKWGGVVFAGAGYYENKVFESALDEYIPSYGLGVRYSVLPSQRINVRFDYARSDNSDAVYLSVTEAF